MFIGPKNWRVALQALDQALDDRKISRSLIVCGGTALLVLDVIDRETRDIDVICPEVDPDLKEIALEVAKRLSLPHDWINDGPKALAKELIEGWKARVELLFQGKALTLHVLGRIDLIATKVYAFCDREDDYQDVIKLKPTSQELDGIYSWVIDRDTSSYWPERVDSCFARLRRSLHGK
jgi:hypothetical protein